MYPTLKEEEQDYVIEQILKFYSNWVKTKLF
jgi:hypothetical protein